MATLYVRLPERRDVPPLRTVDCSPSSSPVSPKLQVTNTTVIHQGNYATVYRGTRSAEGKDEDVVLKFVFGKCAEDLARLRAEHRVYQKMADLQGHCIPKCYGLFQAAFDSVACLVLEFCGEPLCAPFDEADMDLRMGVANALMAIHGHRMQHNNVGPRHVVVKDGRPRIVDFAHAAAHTCSSTAIIFEGDLHPNEHDFGCGELYAYSRDACIWRPGHFIVAGIAIPERDATSVEALEEIVRRRDIRCDPQVLRRDAENAMKLTAIIDEYGGFRPRKDTLAERGIHL